MLCPLSLLQKFQLDPASTTSGVKPCAVHTLNLFIVFCNELHSHAICSLIPYSRKLYSITCCLVPLAPNRSKAVSFDSHNSWLSRTPSIVLVRVGLDEIVFFMRWMARASAQAGSLKISILCANQPNAVPIDARGSSHQEHPRSSKPEPTRSSPL